MAHRDQLANYFASTRTWPENWMGSEIETFFVDREGEAISIQQSQAMLRTLVSPMGWQLVTKKGELITEVRKGTSRVLYELGYPNLELAVCVHERENIIGHGRSLLEELYDAAARCGAYPLFLPIFRSDGNYLAIPDERDATWLSLDGKDSLSPLARISAVQFTINVRAEQAIEKLNRLLAERPMFLENYPQDRVWRTYVESSPAGYRSDRYGGPDKFDSIEHYAYELSQHKVVSGSKLVPFEEAELGSNESISLFVRSVWWHFRLRRYGPNLCIEVRPLPRLRDDCLDGQLEKVLSIMG